MGYNYSACPHHLLRRIAGTLCNSIATSSNDSCLLTDTIADLGVSVDEGRHKGDRGSAQVAEVLSDWLFPGALGSSLCVGSEVPRAQSSRHRTMRENAGRC